MAKFDRNVLASDFAHNLRRFLDLNTPITFDRCRPIGCCGLLRSRAG